MINGYLYNEMSISDIDHDEMKVALFDEAGFKLVKRLLANATGSLISCDKE